MAAGRLFLAAALSLTTVTALPSLIRAEDAAQQDESAGKRFDGVVNANSVYVRSRASEDAYPTMMLKKGNDVTVVGIKGDWLKIVPPEGSFAYVPKSFVNLRGDGTVGRVNQDWIARVGSSLNELAAEPMATLHSGEDVQIIGQHNEYFEIKPPKDSYLWVNKQFVDPAPQKAPAVATNSQTPAPSTGGNEASPSPETAKSDEPPGPTQTAAGGVAKADTTARTPATQPSSDTVAAAPATQPAVADSAAQFDDLEQKFTEAGKKPILEQPLPDLIAGYQKLCQAEDLPSSMRQIAQIRIASLQLRNDAREKFLAVQNDEKKMAAKQQSLIAERQEIEERIRQNDLELYAAVGTLRTSSLQVGQGMLYRLTDPSGGRTVAYIRTNDPKYGDFLGQFVGVKGTIGSDMQLKAIIENPSEIKAVDPSKVNQSIAAQIVPPSLLKFSPNSSGSGEPKPTGAEAGIDKTPQN